jgi:hypothetical protein
LPVEALAAAWHHAAMLCQTEKQFSRTPAAPKSGLRNSMQIPATSNILRRNAILAALAAFLFAILPLHRAAAATNETADSAKVGPPLEVADGFLLAIPKAGFGKDYLFSASLIPQAGAATSTGLAGKIVRFELFPDGVDMYESTRGLVVTDELPARRLLANFAIVRQDGDRVMVDFNKGMRRVFTEAWTQSGGLNLEARDTVLEVPESRVFDARQEEGRLVIRQSVQARNRQSDQNLEARYEVRYFLTPYQPGAFEGKEMEAPDARYVRYFETEGHLEPITGRVSGRIARFDLRKPVVFYYSANTPTNFAGAVQDGILYWNRAFGKEIVQAKKAPAGVTAPDAKYNLIQWVPWDNAERRVAARPGLHHQRFRLRGQSPRPVPAPGHGRTGRAQEGRQEERSRGAPGRALSNLGARLPGGYPCLRAANGAWAAGGARQRRLDRRSRAADFTGLRPRGRRARSRPCPRPAP